MISLVLPYHDIPETADCLYRCRQCKFESVGPRAVDREDCRISSKGTERIALLHIVIEHQYADRDCRKSCQVATRAPICGRERNSRTANDISRRPHVCQ